MLLLVRNSELPIRNNLRNLLGLLTVMILERARKRAFSFKATNLTHVRLKVEKEIAKSLMDSVYSKLSSISK